MSFGRVPGWFLGLSLIAGLGGCADYGGPISGQSNTALTPHERRLQEVETKTAQLVRRMDALNPNESSQNLSRLDEELRTLRGQIEKLQFDLEQMKQSNRQLLGSFDGRIRAIESGAVSASTSASAASAGTSMFGGSAAPETAPSQSGGTSEAAAPTGGLVKATVATPEEERAYLGAFDMLKNGDYNGAVGGFRDMLKQWPQGRYADNGWYWMGEAQLVQREYAGAAKSFESLIRNFPTSPKVADGLHKLALCQIELKREDEARVSLQRVIRDHPTSNAANLAKRKLDQLGG